MKQPGRLIGTLVVGAIAITAATPALTKLTHALVPLVLVVGIVIAVLRAVWFYTR